MTTRHTQRDVHDDDNDDSNARAKCAHEDGNAKDGTVAQTCGDEAAARYHRLNSALTHVDATTTAVCVVT